METIKPLAAFRKVYQPQILDIVLNLNMFNTNTFYKIYERDLERSSLGTKCQC